MITKRQKARYPRRERALDEVRVVLSEAEDRRERWQALGVDPPAHMK